MAEAEDSGTQDIAEESRNADSAEESPEGESLEREYRTHSISENAAYASAKASENGRAREKGKNSGLEEAVSKANANAKEERLNVEHINQQLVYSLAERIEAMHSQDSDEHSDEDSDTENGAVAILCYRDKKTGELEFLFEQKPLDYDVPEARGKLSLIGGAIQIKEKSLDALVRELEEEIEEPAASIAIKFLDKYSFYQRLPFEYNGKKGYSDIYVIEIRHEAGWNVLKQAMFKHDAGSPRVVRQNELRVDDFAFGYGEIVKKFADCNSKIWSKISQSVHPNDHYSAQNMLSSVSKWYGQNGLAA